MGSKNRRAQGQESGTATGLKRAGVMGFLWMIAVGILLVMYYWIDHAAHQHAEIAWYALWSIRYPFLLRLFILVAGLGVSVFVIEVLYAFKNTGRCRFGDRTDVTQWLGLYIGCIGLIGTIVYCVVAYRWDGFIINPPHHMTDGSGPGVIALLIPHSPVMYVLFIVGMVFGMFVLGVIQSYLC